jgi:hypothetical protein
MRHGGAPFLLLLAACAPTISLGDVCTYDSECPVPLACLAGRCRAECLTSRDCPPSLECVNVGGEMAACRVPQDEGCSGDDDCTAPLRCVGGGCSEPCVDGNTCVAENRCDDGACRPVPPLMVGGCSPVGVTSGCDAGEACVRLGDTYDCATASATPLPAGARCTAQGQCGPGTSCVNGRCVRLCARDAPACGPGSRCTDDTLFGLPSDAVRGPAPPDGLGYCTEVCDPLARSGADGCLPETACSLVVPGDGRVYYYCRAVLTPALEPYAPCDAASRDDDHCPVGTVCTDVGHAEGRLCYSFCDVTSGAPCPAGRTCVQVTEASGPPFGLCRLPD